MLFLFRAVSLFCLMIRRPPRSTRTDTLFPYTTLFRSGVHAEAAVAPTGPFLFAGQLSDENPIKPVAGKYLAMYDAAYGRSEEHTSELQSLMRISYAVFCLKQTNTNNHHPPHIGKAQQHNPHPHQHHTSIILPNNK